MPTESVQKYNSIIKLSSIYFLPIKICEAFLTGTCFACGKQPNTPTSYSRKEKFLLGGDSPWVTGGVFEGGERMTPLHNEFLLNYCYRRDVPCQGSMKEMLGEGKIIFISRLAASPQPRRRVRCPPGSPTAAGGAGRGRRRAVPHRRLIRPSSLSAGSSQKKNPKNIFLGGKGRGAAASGPPPKGAPEPQPRCVRPGRPRTGPAPWGAGGTLCVGGCVTEATPQGTQRPPLPSGSPAPLPPSRPRPPRLTPWIPPPEAALPEGTGRGGGRRQLWGNY